MYRNTPYLVTEDDIIELFRAGALTLTQFGFDQLEFRYYGEQDPCKMPLHEDVCNILMVTITAWNGATVFEEGVPHCDDAQHFGEPEDERDYEGIGGRYPSGATFSYMSDEPELLRSFWNAVYRLFPIVNES